MIRREFITASRRCGGMAARGAGAAAKGGADRISWNGHTFSMGPLMGCCHQSAPARTRLDRWTQPRCRVSLGGGPQRAVLRNCGGVRPAQRRCHFHVRRRSACGEAGNINHPDRIRRGDIDPVGGGLVASLARPGGNVTGLSLQFSELAGKRLEFLREVVPTISRLGVLANISYPAVVLERDEVEAAAKALGLQIAKTDIPRAQDIAPAFDVVKAHVQAIYICADALDKVIQPDLHQHSRGWSATSNPARQSGVRRSRRADILRSQPSCCHFGAPPTMWTKYCAAQSRPNFQSSNRLSSIS